MAASTEPRARRHESLALCTFACGTRAAYVRGCRCEPCRAANRVYARERDARRRRRLLELLESGEFAPTASQAVDLAKPCTAPNGEARARRYQRLCPGVAGEPCASSSSLRVDSLGGVCCRCRVRITSEGLVPADRARKHLRALSAKGIGRLSVVAASDVARSAVYWIANGSQRWITARTERRILAVDESCRADGALVPANETWRNVRRLLRAGWSKSAIAAALGSQSATPALQLGRRNVTLRNADRLARLAAKVEQDLASRAAAKAAAERALAGGRCPRCGASHADDPHALRWCLAHQDVPLTTEERVRSVPASGG